MVWWGAVMSTGQLKQRIWQAQSTFDGLEGLPYAKIRNIDEILDEAKAEIPTQADAEKIVKAIINRELKHDGFDVAFTAAIHAELFGKWTDKWFGAP